MDYQERTVRLKNGKACRLRRAVESDAEMLLKYLKIVWGETRYLMREPEDMSLTVEKEREILRERAESDTGLMLLSEVDGEHAGTAFFDAIGKQNRARHRCSVGITLYRAFWGMGVGTALMGEILQRAKMAGYEQAELEVVSANAAAIGLYRKLGFETTGTIPRALKYRDGTYADSLYMVKTLLSSD